MFRLFRSFRLILLILISSVCLISCSNQSSPDGLERLGEPPQNRFPLQGITHNALYTSSVSGYIPPKRGIRYKVYLGEEEIPTTDIFIKDLPYIGYDTDSDGRGYRIADNSTEGLLKRCFSRFIPITIYMLVSIASLFHVIGT